MASLCRCSSIPHSIVNVSLLLDFTYVCNLYANGRRRILERYYTDTHRASLALLFLPKKRDELSLSTIFRVHSCQRAVLQRLALHILLRFIHRVRQKHRAPIGRVVPVLRWIFTSYRLQLPSSHLKSLL